MTDSGGLPEVRQQKRQTDLKSRGLLSGNEGVSHQGFFSKLGFDVVVELYRWSWFGSPSPLTGRAIRQYLGGSPLRKNKPGLHLR
jgi:hypothetical protein